MQFFRYHVCAVGIIKLIQFSYNNCTNWPLGIGDGVAQKHSEMLYAILALRNYDERYAI